MTEAQKGEIRTLYRQSKNKRRQIGILADLYLCTRDEIREVLGLLPPGPAPKETKVPEKKLESPTLAHTRCQPGKAVEIWPEEEDQNMAAEPDTEAIIQEACDMLLEEFDRNEDRMRKLMKKMVPIAAEYRKIEARQHDLAKFIEEYCRLSTNKAD